MRITLWVLFISSLAVAQKWDAPIVNQTNDCYQFKCGFSAPSKVIAENPFGVYRVSAEAVLGPTGNGNSFGVPGYELEFQLPENGTVVAFEGTVSLRSSACQAQAMAWIEIDGMRYAPVILKTAWDDSMSDQSSKRDGKIQPANIFVSYHIPLRYTLGKGKLHVEADPACYDPHHPNTWEIQGLLQVNPALTAN